MIFLDCWEGKLKQRKHKKRRIQTTTTKYKKQHQNASLDGGHHIEMVGKNLYIQSGGERPVWTDCFDVNWCAFGDVLPLAWALRSLSIPTNYVTILSSFDTGEISGCHIGLPLSGTIHVTSWIITCNTPAMPAMSITPWLIFNHLQPNNVINYHPIIGYIISLAISPSIFPWSSH